MRKLSTLNDYIQGDQVGFQGTQIGPLQNSILQSVKTASCEERDYDIITLKIFLDRSTTVVTISV